MILRPDAPCEPADRWSASKQGAVKVPVTGMEESDRQQAPGKGGGMPRQLDAIQFARTSGVLDGSTDVALLERVAQECSPVPARIDWSIAGQVDAEGACWLELALAGSLMLQCQRCLEDVAVGVRSRSRFRLVPAGEEWGDQDLDDDSYEALELDGLLDVRTLIEDEVVCVVGRGHPLARKGMNVEQYLRAVNEEKQASFDLVNERLEQMTAKMGQAKLQGKEGEQNTVVASAPLNDDELLKAFAEIDARNKKAAKNAAKKTNTKAKK